MWMKFKAILRTACIRFAVPVLYCGLLFAQPAHSPLFHIAIDTVRLAHIDENGGDALLDLTATANQTATVRSVVFEHVTVNDIPIRVEPLPGPIRLQNGKAISGLSNIEARVNFRELSSFGSLRQIVTDGKANVRATVRAQPDLNLFQKLALFIGGPWVVTEVDQGVQVEIPGGFLGRAAALAALSAAESIWIGGQAGQQWRRNRRELASKAEAGMADALVSIETTYELRSRDGEITIGHNSGKGFLIGDGQILASMEAVEPWSFNPGLAEALANHDVTLMPEHTEISACLVTSSAYTSQIASLQRKDLRILKIQQGHETGISIATKHKYPLRIRTSDENAALLGAPAWKNKPALKIASTTTEDWKPAAIYRVRQENGVLRPVLWFTEVRRENGQFRLRDQLDSTAFGSPLWVGDGVVGMVQSEDTAEDLNSVLKRLE